MDSTGLDQMTAGSGGSPPPGLVYRDQLTAGLVLARTILAEPAAAAAARQAITEFHASVVRPLLRNGVAERQQLLRWARALDAAAVLEGAALTVEAALGEMLTAEFSPEEVAWDLMQLADQIAQPQPAGPFPSAAGSELLIEQPGGGCLILAIRDDKAERWRAVLDGADWAAAAVAVQTVLSSFPGALPAFSSARSECPCICWPPGVALTTEAIALPLALGQLSETTGLSAGGLLTAGHFDGERFLAPEQAQLRARAAAAGVADRDLLVPAAAGWQRIAADGSPPQLIRAPQTLDGAASVIWGEDWAKWKRAAHAAELGRLDWHFVDWRETPAGQPIADRWVRQVRQLERYCLDEAGPGSLVILGGPAHSGRSAIVRQLARSLATRKRPWQVQVITGPTRELPDRHTALEIAAHALASTISPERAAHRLLVLEDLQPIRNGNASEVLRYIAEQLNIIVLGVLEYADNSPVEWDTEDTFVATSVVSKNQRKQFIDDLAAADATLDPAPALEALNRGRPVALRMLTMLMNGDVDAATRRFERFAEMSGEERAVLVFAAVTSLVSGELGDDELAVITQPDRTLFGVGPGRGPSTLRLASAEDCFALLDLHLGKSTPSVPWERQWRTIYSTMASQLEPELGRLLGNGDTKVGGWLEGVRLFHSDLCRTLLKAAAADGLLQEWAARTPVMSVIHAIALVDLMPDHAAQEYMEQLITRACRGPRQWSPAELLTLMRSCQQVEFLLSSATLEELVLWVAASVDRAIAAGAGRPDERLALLAALDRFNRPEGASVIAERALDVLAGVTVCEDDYRLVQQVDRLQRKAKNKAPSMPLFPVDQETPVRSLLTHEPDPADGVGVLLAAMNLRLNFDRNIEFQSIFSEYEIALNQALRFATAPELTRALHAIRSPVPQMPTWLLWNWFGFRARVKDLMWRNAGATEVAALLNVVARIHLQVAAKLLNDQHSDQLLNELARRSAGSRDAKGIGQLLSATQSIEEAFGRGSFCTELAEAVGKDSIQALIRDDPRTSVRYHIIKGVWDARASYRSEVLEAVLSIIIDAVRRGRKHWGPEIALRLAQDPEMGATALAELRRRIPPETLLYGMTSAITAHGRALFHRLGRALHADVPARFLLNWELASFVEGITTSSPTAALEVCVEVSRTLTDANVPEAGALIATATGGAERWAHRLRFGRQEGAFAQAIRDLTSLDPATAGEVLDRLRDTPSRLLIGGHPADALLARLRNAMLDEPTIAPLMLRAIHEVRPQLASGLLADITDDQHAVYVFRGGIQQLQNPAALSAAVRNLIRVGVIRGSAQSAWIKPVFELWLQALPYMTGTRSVAVTLRMLGTWDERLGMAGTQAMRVARVTDRLRSGAPTDVAGAIQLALTLAALNNAATAQQILEQLLSIDIMWAGEHLDVGLLCATVDICRELMPDAVPRLARALTAAVKSLVEQSVVLDERANWLQVGRACRILRREGMPVTQIGEARIAPNVVYAPAVAWAATGIDQPGWGKDVRGEDALGRSAARLAALPHLPDVTDRACVLSATGHSWARELRAGRNSWDVGAAPFWLLRILYAEVATDPYLAPVLAACEPTIVRRANRDAARPDWDANQLRQMLGARSILEARTSTEDL